MTCKSRSTTCDTWCDVSDGCVDMKVKQPEVSLEELSRISREIDKNLAMSFVGLPVRVDSGLKGNQHYIAVSSELHEKMKLEAK